MIRINLLGVPKRTSRGRRATAAAAGGGGEGSSTIVLGLVFIGALAVLIGVAQVWVTREHDKLEKDLQKAILENQRLAEVKAKYEASKKRSDMYERRVRVIDELKAQQSGPVNMLTFTGMALSPNAVADLMANLRKTGAFKTVEIKETLQDATVKEVQAFKFELNCEIAPSFTGKVQKQS